MRAIALILAAVMIAPMVVGAQHAASPADLARKPATPACGSPVVCIQDSTRVASHECCETSTYSEWLILPAPGDSLEFYVLARPGSDGTPSLSLARTAPPGRWREDLPDQNAAPYLRHRFREAGAYVLSADISDVEHEVGVPYELRTRAASSKYAIAPSPLLLTLAGGEKARFIVRPRRAASSDADAARDYTVPGGIYRILAPGADSIEVCRKPCSGVTVVGLTQRTVRVAR